MTDDEGLNLQRLRNALRVKDRQQGDLKFFRHVDGLDLVARMFVGTDQACIINSAKHRFDHVTLRGLELTSEGPCDWGLQLYNVADLLVEHCWFHDFTYPKVDGHAAYLRAHGNVTFRHGLTQRCHGQGIQSAKRGGHHGGYEALDVALFADPSVFRVEDWTFEDCSTPGGKHAGFVLSFFAFQDDSPDAWRPGVGQVVELVDVRMRHRIGGVTCLVEGGPHGHPRALLQSCDFDYPDSEGRGETAIFRFVPHLRLLDGNWNGGRVKVLVDPFDDVQVSGYSGNAELWVYEHTVGDDGLRRLARIHKGTIREGYVHLPEASS